MKKKKKNDLVIIRENNSLPEVDVAIKNTLEEIRDKAAEMIDEGRSKPTASTGTPIDELKGLPKIIAEKSNIGGGSKATGGGGYEEGDRIIKIHDAAIVALKTLEAVDEKREHLDSSVSELAQKSIESASE